MAYNPYFDPVIGRYIRDRIASESKGWGGCAEISRATGFSRAHLSNILDGTRAVGEDFANAMCKYWNIKQIDLPRIAHEACGSDALNIPRKTHPELDITLDFCRRTYPDAFLREFEASARMKPDKTKLEWFVELNTLFRLWLGRLAPAGVRQYQHLLEVPLSSLEKTRRNPPGRPRKSVAG